MAARAEGRLQSTTYSGETKRWNFEKYVGMHVDQHTILQGLTQYGYSEIDPRSKVRYFLGGIKTTTLDSVKANVMSNAVLRSDFDATASLYKDYIEQMKASTPMKEAHIAAIDIKDKRKYDAHADVDGVKPDMTMDDRYYSATEYQKLTAEQKAGLFKRRQQRLEPGGGGGRGRGKGEGRKQKTSGRGFGGRFATKGTQISKASIKAIAQKVVAFNLEHEDYDDDDQDDDDQASVESSTNSPKKQKIVKTNRVNSALKRGGKKKNG